jgi:hypothetical protein
MPAGDITQGYIFVPAEKSIDQVKMNAIVGQAYINPAFISGQTATSSTGTGDYFVFLQSGGTLAKILTQDLGNSLAQTTGFQSQIWSTRLRSFNSVGNSDFGVDQRNVGTALTNPASGTFMLDRWAILKNVSTLTVNTQQVAANPGLLPGTNFKISAKQLNITLTAQQASLAAANYCSISQQIEGSAARELINDVTSISVLAYCTVPLKFSVAIRDPTASRSLVKLCTIPTGNTWTLITLPNIPVFPAAGTFAILPGAVGYMLDICLATGSTNMAPAADTWQTGNFLGAPGMDNFGAQALNTIFILGALQHEPGSQSTTLIDKPFSQSLIECQRYFSKTYSYTVKPGTASSFEGANASFITASSTSGANGYGAFSTTMAKSPSVTIYNPNTGAINSAFDSINAGNVALTGVLYAGDKAFLQLGSSAAFTAGHNYAVHYTADTGW